MRTRSAILVSLVSCALAGCGKSSLSGGANGGKSVSGEGAKKGAEGGREPSDAGIGSEETAIVPVVVLGAYIVCALLDGGAAEEVGVGCSLKTRDGGPIARDALTVTWSAVDKDAPSAAARIEAVADSKVVETKLFVPKATAARYVVGVADAQAKALPVKALVLGEALPALSASVPATNAVPTEPQPFQQESFCADGEVWRGSDGCVPVDGAVPRWFRLRLTSLKCAAEAIPGVATVAEAEFFWDDAWQQNSMTEGSAGGIGSIAANVSAVEDNKTAPNPSWFAFDGSLGTSHLTAALFASTEPCSELSPTSIDVTFDARFNKRPTKVRLRSGGQTARIDAFHVETSIDGVNFRKDESIETSFEPLL